MAFLDETGLQTLWTKIKNTFALTTHSHGNIKSNGIVGTTSGLPLITSTGGAVTTGSFGSAAGTFCQGNDARVVSAINSATMSSYVAGATVTSAGTATTATKLTTSTYGGTAQPIYISSGVPTTIGYTISKSVPADANFSNTTYTGASGITLTGTTFSHTTGNGWGHIPSNGSAGQILEYSAAGVAKWVNPPTGGITSTQAVDAVSAAGYTTSNYVSTYVAGATAASAGTATNASSLGGSAASAYEKVGHTHSYLPLSGGTMTGKISFANSINPLIECTWSDVDIAATSRNAVANKLHTCVLDKNGIRFGGMESTANTDGSNEFHYTMRNHANNAWLNDYFLKEDASGNTSAIISHTAKLQSNTSVGGTLHVANSLFVDNGYIYGTDNAFVKGSTPSGDNYLFELLATDKNGTAQANRLGAYQVYVNSNGAVANEISVYDNTSGSTATGARLVVWKPKNDSGFVTIPSARPAAGDSSTKVPDTAWVSNATVASAKTLTTTLPVSKGGTGATTLASAGIATKVGISTQTFASSTARNAYYEVNLGGTKYQVAYGRLSVSSSGTTVTFANAFNAAPFVLATAAPTSTPTGSGNNLSVLPGIATATNCPLLVRGTTGTAITAWVNYVAIGTGK